MSLWWDVILNATNTKSMTERVWTCFFCDCSGHRSQYSQTSSSHQPGIWWFYQILNLRWCGSPRLRTACERPSQGYLWSCRARVRVKSVVYPRRWYIGIAIRWYSTYIYIYIYMCIYIYNYIYIHIYIYIYIHIYIELIHGGQAWTKVHMPLAPTSSAPKSASRMDGAEESAHV